MGEEETESEECKRALLKQTLSGGKGFPGGLDSKESACNAGDPGPIPGLGRSSGEENGNSLQYCCLENPMNRGDWQATVWVVQFRSSG